MQKKDYPKLRSCPFCGGRAHLVVREDDGGYRATIYCTSGAEIGCFTKMSHWALKKSWVTKSATEAWNRRAQPANEPLTLEQLKQMDGKPVWCADGGGHSCYCLVNAESEDCIDSECGAWCFEFYGMTGDGENGLNNMGWLAYDHKQGGEQE